MRASPTLVIGLVAAGCGAGSGTPAVDAPPAATVDARPHVPGDPGAGAHALSYFPVVSHAETLEAPAMVTRATGSILIASVGRGHADASVAPTDNRGNPAFEALDAVHEYTQWPGSGTALYGLTDVAGGDGHVVQVATPYDDEITLSVVEVFDAEAIADVSWIEVPVGSPLTSAPVTTRGPAVLVAFWWGDGGYDFDKTAVPDSGFTVVDSILLEGSIVLCATAVKEVSEAGTYDVTWTSTPAQGAQLWLVAVE